MTQTAGSTDTFDSAALKESLDSVIWDLFPMDTYFVSNVDKVNVGNTQHQWVFDQLAAAAANKQLEGDAFTAATLVTATRVSNYTQISNKSILLTGTHQATDAVGGNPMGRAVLKAMKELKRDMEFTCLGTQGSSAGATATARATGGVLAWIWGQTAAVPGNQVIAKAAGTNANTTTTTPSYASSVVTGAVVGTTGTVAMTIADITEGLQLAWTDGGEVDTILASAAQKNVLDGLASGATRMIDLGKLDKLPITNSANVIVTSYGTCKVVLSRYLRRDSAIGFDLPMWALGQLRAPKVVDMAKREDGDAKLMVAEYTVIARNPNSSTSWFGMYPGA
jgi:hypothetical protein